MAREKRTRPCSSCKKSKVKCIYNERLPCERCIKIGQAAKCLFVPKLPPPRLPDFTSQQASLAGGQRVEDITLPPFNAIGGLAPLSQKNVGTGFMIHNTHQKDQPGSLVQGHQPVVGTSDLNDLQWKGQIESRISSFDNKLNDLVEILKSNQRFMIEQNHGQSNVSQHNKSSSYSSQSSSGLPNPQVEYSSENDVKVLEHQGMNLANERVLVQASKSSFSSKRRRIDKNDTRDSMLPEDFRDGFIDIDEAKEYFAFFDTHISPQLFGFEISKLSVESIWKSSPILICAICTIASMHHPSKMSSDKLKYLQQYLHNLCKDLLFKSRPKNTVDGFNTIFALVLCSFWLSDSQKFTGLALQIAKEIGLDSPDVTKHQGGLTERDRLKLWYLLYVLDGQQSITFNRQPLVNPYEYTLKHGRQILLAHEDNFSIEGSDTFESDNGKLTASKKLPGPYLRNNERQEVSKSQLYLDMRLISQVEYNQALNEAFRGNAWELLAPSSFGIPSRTNLELDKWMVSWTVLLSPVNNGTVWSSKSTLIYYNFAKMHINSTIVRQLKLDAMDNEDSLPKWNEKLNGAKRIEALDSIGGPIDNGPKNRRSKSKTRLGPEADDDGDDNDDDDQFISNKELISDNDAAVSASIAVNAAQTVLNLVLNDNDIIENLKYVPVHIHIMLYYAALLLINPPMESDNKTDIYDLKAFYTKVLNNVKIVKLFQLKISQNSPTDKKFGNRLIRSLNEIIEEKLSSIREELRSLNLDEETISSLDKQATYLQGVLKLSHNGISMESLCDSSSSRSTSPSPEKIFAWPGRNHGHP